MRVMSMAECVRRLLRSQMLAKGMDYRRLAQRLNDFDLPLSPSTLRSKINTGTLSAQLFLQIQFALKQRCLHMDEVAEIFDDVAREKSVAESDCKRMF